MNANPSPPATQSPLAERLRLLRLSTMAEELEPALERAAKANLSIRETLGRLADRELEERRRRAVKRRFRVLMHEDVAEMDYRPVKCWRGYRMVVLRKRIEVKRGQKRLFDQVEHFFYVTNVPPRELSAAGAVRESNSRCDQENVIEQLKNGVEAMRMPSDTLDSNWVYLVIASQAWNLKSWLGLALPEGKGARKLVRMHFRRFLREWVQIPCQVVRRGGQLIFRLLSRNQWTPLLIHGSRLLRTGRLAF